MNKKIASIVSGVALLATSFMPMQASALSTAKISLSGAQSTTGKFAVTIYEDTGSDTVTSAYVTVDFSGSVTGVSYDYVAPFSNPTPSGAHAVAGEVNGKNPVAVVNFTVTTPSTVTATISGASFLKHANRDANGNAIGSENFPIERGSATFTYAPVQGGQGGGTDGGSSSGDNPTTTTTTSGRNTAVAQNTGNADGNTAAPAQAAEKKDEAKNENETKGAATGQQPGQESQNASGENTAGKKSVWPWVVLILVIGAAIAYTLRNRATGTQKTAETKTVKPTEAPRTPKFAAAPAAAAAAGAKKAAPAKTSKPAVKKNAGNRKSGKKSR